MREAVFLEHVPTVPFEDYAPAQLPYDEEMEVSNEELVLGEPLLPVTAAEEQQTEFAVFEPQPEQEQEDEIEIVHITTQ